MSNSRPRVSVVMAAYNSASYIERAIRSFLEQTYPDTTLYICNDCSRDDTGEIAERYSRENDRIKVLHNEVNSGFVATMNRLFEAADSDYICILDSDDWMTPNRVEHQVSIIEKYGADAVLSEYIHTDGKDNFTYSAFKYPEPTLMDPGSRDVVGSSGSLMMSKKVQKAITGYHTYFADAFCADVYMIYKIASDFKLYYDPSHLYFYVQTPGSMTQTFDLYKLSKLSLAVEIVREQKMGGKDLLESCEFEELERRRLKIVNNRKWRSVQYQMYAARFTDQQMLKTAVPMSFKAIWNDPFNFAAYRSLLYSIRSSAKRLFT